MSSAIHLLRRARSDAKGLFELILPGSVADLTTEAGRGAERNRRAALTSVTGIGARLVSITVSIVTVPLLLHHLGVERYGIWLTISAGAAWLGLVQFGVAPSLLNRLSSAAHQETALRRGLTSTAWWVAAAIGLLAVVPLVVLYQVASWAALFNVSPGELADDGRAVAALVWLGVAAGLPLGVPITILRSRQEGYLANALETAASVGRLLLLVVLIALGVGMVGLALALTLFGLLVGTAGAAFVFLLRAPELRPARTAFDLSAARSLLGTGASFTVLSIAALVIGYTDVIVITQILGPAEVPTYAIAFSLLTMFVGLELAILDAVWPAYAEAAARGDRAWLQSTHRRITMLFTGTASLFGLGVVVLGQPVIRFWAGEGVVPPISLLVTLAILAIVQACQLPHGRMLTALGRVRLNSVLGIANASINLPVSIWLASTLGITGVAIGTVVGYTVIGAALVLAARGAMKALPDGRPEADPISAGLGA